MTPLTPTPATYKWQSYQGPSGGPPPRAPPRRRLVAAPPTQSVTDAASCTCATACQFRRGPSGGPLPRAPPLQRPVQSCDLRVDPRLREWTSLRGDGLRRRPAQYMAGRADDAHACDVHLTTLPGALRRASAQGPASEAARTTLHPPGGPPPEEADGAMYILPPSTTHTHTHTHARMHTPTITHTHTLLEHITLVDTT